MYTGYSSVDTDLIPRSAPVVFAYATGSYAQIGAVHEHCPRSRVVSICTEGRAVCGMYDFEAGALLYSEVNDIVNFAHNHGIRRPIVYAALDAMQMEVRPRLEGSFSRDSYRLVPAHFTDSPELPAWADGVEWTQTALGRNLNEYLLRDDFLGAVRKVPDVTRTITVEWDETAKDWRVKSLQKGEFQHA